MRRTHRRTAELLAVVLGFFAVYVLVVGPAIGAVLPGFDQPAFSQDGLLDRPTGDLPDTARGWLLVALEVPVLLGYMYLRARRAGCGLEEFWNPPDG